jgi:hypothetical protein
LRSVSVAGFVSLVVFAGVVAGVTSDDPVFFRPGDFDRWLLSMIPENLHPGTLPLPSHFARRPNGVRPATSEPEQFGHFLS